MAANGFPTVAAILVAAGAGERLGAQQPKAFVPVAGRTLLEHAAGRFIGHSAVRDVIIAAPEGLADEAARQVPSASVVVGGATRQLSVSRALAAVSPDVQLVLVHDVARAFVPAEVIDRVLAALQLPGTDAAVPVLPITDTVRRCDPTTEELGELVDRSALRAMQTPQGFPRAVLERAHAGGAALTVTDDVALVEALGGRVRAVRGDERAFKITVPLDLALAEVVAAQLGVPDPR
jgi:2-C-methyl-D-erythritol 4-phosphate cytidylyltransferase